MCGICVMSWSKRGLQNEAHPSPSEMTALSFQDLCICYVTCQEGEVKIKECSGSSIFSQLGLLSQSTLHLKTNEPGQFSIKVPVDPCLVSRCPASQCICNGQEKMARSLTSHDPNGIPGPHCGISSCEDLDFNT